jgi:aspartate carbamoyltransferase catalytic subunit
MAHQFDGWPHVICAQQFSREWLEKVFLPLADEMEHVFDLGGCNVLKGKRMVSLFYQPSTRTRMSFEMAMDYLGGKVVFSSENAGEFSSAKKGETLRDSFLVINRYRPDVIVIRYNGQMSPDFVAQFSRAPVLSGGDREPGQHPTQALLDLRTIFKRRGSIDGLKIAMVGDLDKGRTVRSLSYLLGKFKDVEIFFVSPSKMRMGEDVKGYLIKHGVRFTEWLDLRRVAPNVDVIYQTRTQEECGTSLNRQDHSIGYFLVNKEVAASMKLDAMILHPLPRNDEIPTDVDDDPRSAYIADQIDSGLFTRMALLKLILAPHV